MWLQLKAYPTLLRAYWAYALTYRSQSIIWILSGVVPLVMMMAWLKVAEQQGGSVGNYDRQAFIAYYLAVIFMRRMTGLWLFWEMDQDIRLGKLSPKLLRPIDPAHFLFSRALAFRPLQLILVGPPLILAAWLLNIQYDVTPTNILLMLIAIFGAMLIEFCAQMCIAMLSFWITQAESLVQVWFFVRALLSGWVVPLDLLPTAVFDTLLYLPFRYILSFPTEMLLGRLTLAEVGLGFLIQYSWALGLFLLYRLLWQVGLRNYSAVGA